MIHSGILHLTRNQTDRNLQYKVCQAKTAILKASGLLEA